MRLIVMLCVGLIFAMGVLMIFSTTSAEALEFDLAQNSHQALFKQFVYALIGTALASIVHQCGYRKFLSWSPWLLAALIFCLLLVLIPGIGREVNGSKRWLNLAGFSFQPSEFVKYVVPAYFIYRLDQLNVQKWTFRQFLKLIAVPTFPIFLILVEPNNGTAMVIAVSLIVLCLLCCIPMRFWALPLLVFGLIGGLFASQLPYVKARLNVYLHPELDLKGRGHQPYQAKIAVGSGGLIGRGPGNSFQKLSYLPEAQNDYIAAIYAEEFGFLGIFGLISLYAILICLGYYIALQAPDQSGLYLAGSIIFLIGFQSFLNLGVVSGLLPSTGLNLPFFSQGGSSLMANFLGMGLLLSIYHPGPSKSLLQINQSNLF